MRNCGRSWTTEQKARMAEGMRLAWKQRKERRMRDLESLSLLIDDLQRRVSGAEAAIGTLSSLSAQHTMFPASTAHPARWDNEPTPMPGVNPDDPSAGGRCECGKSMEACAKTDQQVIQPSPTPAEVRTDKEKEIGEIPVEDRVGPTCPAAIACAVAVRVGQPLNYELRAQVRDAIAAERTALRALARERDRALKAEDIHRRAAFELQTQRDALQRRLDAVMALAERWKAIGSWDWIASQILFAAQPAKEAK